eukprot:CAMPEP_0206141720 /NCGR_PEP_ID=MMETSP1473-20131121/13874_1 /ASSEMBLY_ACC=CAM_ASM_001109 /TAXON_ID=1461547 /ORGANISM="Stichococcus sp, Strain RCC1054" /LENGTH=454 /DNA_ID=CAMNT_0053536399 /DNA_START=73 /DNA_END=1437 /DNA_ORIENTATION=-
MPWGFVVSPQAIALVLLAQTIVFGSFHYRAAVSTAFTSASDQELGHSTPGANGTGAEGPNTPAAWAVGNMLRGCTAGAERAPNAAVAAVVMVVFNRPDYLRKSIDSLKSVHARDDSFKEKFPLFISQDGTHREVRDLAMSLQPEIGYLNNIEDAPPKLAKMREQIAYYRIANHYRFIMQQMFDCRQYQKLIFVEDDMLFAPDFFNYFESTAQILEEDTSLWCVSSWNDHGQKQFVDDPLRILRSDFFPGLGWMLRRDTWDSLRDSWPAAYWDDYMREGHVRRGRQCLRPEVCRTYNFGKVGSSKGQFFERYFTPIRLNNAAVPWQDLDLSYLKYEEYDTAFNKTLAEALELHTLNELDAAHGNVKVLYKNWREYELIAGRLGMLKEWKAGVPRGAYRGTVQLSWRGGQARVIITPAPDYVDVPRKGHGVDKHGGLITGDRGRRKHSSKRDRGWG